MSKRLSGFYVPFSCSEEVKKRLVLDAASGNRDAVSKVIGCCTLLVYESAHRRTSSEDDFDDLVQDGMIGVLNALRCFNPGRGSSFTTYAMYAIRSEMNREKCKTDTRVESLSTADCVIPEYRQSLITEEAAVSHLMLDETIERINRILSSKERNIVRLVSGIETGKHESFAETGRILGISEDSARRTYSKAVCKLRR